MQMALIPNMEFSRHAQINGMDKRPFKGDFVGKKDIGPLNINLDIPNELESKLNTNVKRGRA